MTHHPITDLLQFNAANVKSVARTINFADQEIIQQITETGVTHGTAGYPLDTHLYRNHQGAAVHFDEVTPIFLSKIQDHHFARTDGSYMRDQATPFSYSSHEIPSLPKVASHFQQSPPSASRSKPMPSVPAMPIPDMLPAILVPINGTEQRLKADQWYARNAGDDFKRNVRPTFDCSSPHDERDPNSHCTLTDDLNTPWVSISHVVWGLSILASVGSRLRGWKIDLKGAYMQLVMNHTLTCRQFVFWEWIQDDKLHGGFFRDLRMQWGAKQSGSTFHRGVTSLIVRWIIHVLLSDWLPTISCPDTLAWVAARVDAGFSDSQTLPALVNGFLDDFFLFACGTEDDIERAHALAIHAIWFLGFKISASKYAIEGTPKEEVEVLGHALHLDALQRAVTQHKADRISQDIQSLLSRSTWPKDTLEALIGLIQSVREDIGVRLNLFPLYAVLWAGHSRSGPPTYPSPAAVRVLQKVARCLHKPRPFYSSTTQWPTPASVICDGIPVTDATPTGYGGVFLHDSTLFYFAGQWPRHFQSVHIDVYEAITVLLAAATWSSHLRHHKRIFRCDNKNSVFAFNALKTSSHYMQLAVYAWEDVQEEAMFDNYFIKIFKRQHRT